VWGFGEGEGAQEREGGREGGRGGRGGIYQRLMRESVSLRRFLSASSSRTASVMRSCAYRRTRNVTTQTQQALGPETEALSITPECQSPDETTAEHGPLVRIPTPVPWDWGISYLMSDRSKTASPVPARIAGGIGPRARDASDRSRASAQARLAPWTACPPLAGAPPAHTQRARGE
jgi:hypothetical protein